MIKTLLTLAVAGLVLVGCGRSDEPKSVTYYTRVITCDMGGSELKVFKFEDTDKVFHYFYTNDGRFNIDTYDRETRSLIEEYYWMGVCYSRETWKKVIIEPEIPTEELS